MTDIKVEMEKVRQEGRERIAATGQTICVFAENVPASIAEDILAGMRLTTDRANKKYDKEAQQREWYNYYNNGLIKFGWTLTDTAHAEEGINEETVTLAELMSYVLTVTVNRDPNRTEAAKRVVKTILQVKEVKTHLEQHSHSESGKSSHFVIAQCEMTPQGLPAMLMTSFQACYTSKVEPDGALNRKIDSASTRLYRASQQGIFSVRHFDSVRALINDRLKGDIAEFLAI